MNKKIDYFLLLNILFLILLFIMSANLNSPVVDLSNHSMLSGLLFYVILIVSLRWLPIIILFSLIMFIFKGKIGEFYVLYNKVIIILFVINIILFGIVSLGGDIFVVK